MTRPEMAENNFPVESCAIKSDAHELGNASNYAGSARLALLDHPNARQALHSRITFNRTRRKPVGRFHKSRIKLRFIRATYF